MSRKHFVMIANAFLLAQPLTQGDDLTNWRKAIHSLADKLASTNPRFDRGRFVKACGA